MNSASGDSQKVMKDFNEFMQESERMMSKSQNAASQEENKNKPPRMTPLITSVPFVEIRRTCDATLAKRCQGYHNVAFLPVSSKESTIQEPANGIHPSQLNHYKSTPNYYEVKCQPVYENQPNLVQPQIIQTEEPKVSSDLKKDPGDLTSCQEKICCCQRVERTCCCSRRNLCCCMGSDDCVFRCRLSERCCHQGCNKRASCDCSKPPKSRPCSSSKHDAVVQTSSDISSNSFSQKEDSLQKEVLFDSTEYILRQLLETLKKNQKALKIGLESTEDIPDDYKCFCDDNSKSSEKQKPDKKSKLDEIINRIKQKQSIKKRRPVKKVTVDWGEKNQYEFCHEDEGSNCNCGLSERIKAKAKNKLCNPLYN